MGWESRDWAKWTDEERNRYLGSTGATAPAVVTAPAARSRRTEVTLLAAVVSGLLTFAGWHVHVAGMRPVQRPLVFTPPAVVYGTGLSHVNGTNQQLTCTAINGTTCTAWTYVTAGQRIVQPTPLPAGTACSSVEADQRTGRWVCTAP